MSFDVANFNTSSLVRPRALDVTCLSQEDADFKKLSVHQIKPLTHLAAFHEDQRTESHPLQSQDESVHGDVAQQHLPKSLFDDCQKETSR